MAITLTLIGLQIAASLINQKYNEKNLKEIKEMQQKAKSAAQKRMVERDYKKFQRACDYQYQIETEAHTERLRAIEQEFLTAFDKMAHNANLGLHYPLNISPYIINRSVIPIKGTQLNHSRQEVFCILTNSNDKLFNKEVIPFLDNILCNTIASYWNAESLHTMCYFSNTWNERIPFCDEDIDNLKSTISTPTITITPYFEKNEEGGYALAVKLNIWGVGSEISMHLPTGLQFDSIPAKDKYSTHQIDDIVAKLIPWMICATAQAIDVYYWETYHLPPLLPSLISQGKILLDDAAKASFKKSYVALYDTLVLGRTDGIVKTLLETSLISDVALINQCNNPDDNIKFLKDLACLIDSSAETESLIRNSFIYLYESCTGEKYESISSVKVGLLQKDDMVSIRSLIQIAKQTQNNLLAKDLISIVKNKIQYWT